VNTEKMVEDSETITFARPIINSNIDQLFKLRKGMFLEKKKNRNKVSAAEGQ
jgi:hypothetical protein